jgi:hypothetical protein
MPPALRTAAPVSRAPPRVSPFPQQAPLSRGLSSSASRVTGRGTKPGRRWRAMAAARVWRGVRERERRGSGSGWDRADRSPLSIAKAGDRRWPESPYPPAIRGPPHTAHRVLSIVEVKEMGHEKTILPLTDVQNHLPATARNERRGPYE